jgi:hypothetical protein
MASIGLPAIASGRGKGKRSAAGITAEDTKAISDATWSALIGMVATGVKMKDAAQKLGIRNCALEGALKTDKKRAEQWEEARLLALRQIWDIESMEAALASIASGSTVKQACAAVGMAGHENSFYSLVLKDPVIKTLYEEARLIQAEKMAIDDLIEISDDTSQDETWDGKSNSAAVNRSRLQVDSRKWIASKMHYRRFGDKIQQDVEVNMVIDHAARLDAARKRKEAMHANRSNTIPQRQEKVINDS